MRPDSTQPAQSVLLLHCSGSSGRQWDGLAGYLAPRHRVVAPDLYGYGAAKPWCSPGPLSLAAEADRIDGESAAALGDNEQGVHLVGHSYGGAVALRYALQRPGRIRSLTLIEPVAFHLLREGGKSDRRLLDAVRRLAAGVIERTITGDYHGAMEQFVDYWNGKGAWSNTSKDTRRKLSLQAPKVVLDFHAAVSESATLNDYRRLFSFPVSILRGGASPMPVRAVAARLAASIPGGVLRTIEGAGHMLPLTHPHELRRIILAHLGERSPDQDIAA